MRFLVDECLPRQITHLLRSNGHDVLDPRESNLRGADDELLLRIAIDEDRIIVTRDLTFHISKRKPPGILLIRLPSHLSPEEISKVFNEFIKKQGLKRIAGTVASLNAVRVRFHPLPED